MNNIDRVSKDVKIIVDSTKDLLEKNIVSFLKDNEIQITVEQVSKLLDVVKKSIDDNYQRALPTFQNTIKKYVHEK